MCTPLTLRLAKHVPFLGTILADHLEAHRRSALTALPWGVVTPTAPEIERRTQMRGKTAGENRGFQRVG